MGFLDFRVANPWKVSVATTWPRAVLQCLFFALLGSTLAGRDYAFVGSVALAIAVPASVGMADIPMTDKWMRTFFRIRLARRNTTAVIAARAIPWLVEAMIMFTLATVCVGLAVDRVGLAIKIMTLFPVFALMAVTNAAAGLAVASFGVARNADVLLGNVLSYLIIAAGGIIVPASRLPWLDQVGRWLPIRNGLLAVRAIIAHRPWGRHLLAEAIVCACWAAAAIAGYGYREIQARRNGVDAFA